MKTDAFEKIVAPFISRKRDINLVIGILNSGDRQVFSFDQSSGKALQASDGNTLFEIGSITKVFTSLLLSVQVVGNKLRLEDSLCKLSPACRKLHEAITLAHLATHTSGMPRLPANGKKSYRADKKNPYAAYGESDLREFLAEYKGGPNGGQFDRISYSNLGAGLLGYVLAEQAGDSFEHAITETICQPLGMLDTTITLNRKQKDRLAPALTSKGKPAKNWDFDVLAGAGAIRSTVNDMLTFMEANLHTPDSTLGHAMALSHTLRARDPLAPKPARAIETLLKKLRRNTTRPPLEAYRGGIGLGWFLSPNPQTGQMIRWHNGGTGGYTSYIGINEEKSVGVVVLANDGFGLRAMLGKHSVDAMGRNILASL